MPRLPSIPFLVDSLGRAQQKIRKLKPIEKEAKELGVRLVERLELKAAESKLVAGRKFAGTISACGFERSLTDKEALIEFLGQELYIEESKILLGRLDELVTEGTLTAQQVESVVTKLQTGHRTFTILPKAA